MAPAAPHASAASTSCGRSARGAVGSVFVATRFEDKGDPSAERFALKVPEYSATAARSLSEAEFLKMFRDEASALIALPQHPNLARFVTFDAGSKPKPILVMELVEGRRSSTSSSARGVDTARALQALDDVLAGSRRCTRPASATSISSRRTSSCAAASRRCSSTSAWRGGTYGPGARPGAYGAPEVWGALEGREDLTPMKADVYAFGCVAFEALTGRVLFEADTEMAQIAKHVGHDGFPPALRALSKRTDLAPVTELLFSTLRHDPAMRPTASAVRKELARLTPVLAQASWPLSRVSGGDRSRCGTRPIRTAPTAWPAAAAATTGPAPCTCSSRTRSGCSGARTAKSYSGA